MKLESPKVSIGKSSDEIFSYLSDVSNFEHIMPDNIDKFEAGNESFIFALKGMPEIKLQIKEKIAPQKIVLGSTSDKLAFSLTAAIEDTADDKCNAQLLFEGDFNPMVAMMVKKPLQKFIDTLITNIQNK